MEKSASGYLEVILGPMFSGKTSKLVEIYKQYTFCNIPILVINHSEDTRYSDTDMMTHDLVKLKCIQSNTILSVLNDHIHLFEQRKPLAVLINEGQFFPDLYTTVYRMVFEFNASVYVAGLDGDFKQKKFGQILDLIPICDKVFKLHSLCVKCKDGTKAIFSHRINQECEDQKQIGAEEAYIPVCRKCRNEKLNVLMLEK
jgi:thymidine kinase